MSTLQRPLDADHAGERAERDLSDLFRAHTSPAFFRIACNAANVDLSQTGNPPSLATLEKGSQDSEEAPHVRRLPDALRDLRADLEARRDSAEQKLALFDDVETARVIPEATDKQERLRRAREFRTEAMKLIDAGLVGENGSDAIRAAMHRSHDRRMKVVELIRRDEESHARRLATCGERSVQLGCPTMMGGCGHEENYVPLSCKSRLCPECQRRRIGREIGKFVPVVEQWDNPVMIRVGLDGRRDDVHAARDELRDVLNRFTRRKVPPSGTHQAKRWVWRNDGGEPADHYWKAGLTGSGCPQTAGRWEREYVRVGRWVPVDEILPSRFYGIDQKQGDDGTWNVHLHMLADARYLPQAALASVWEDCGGGPNVHIQQIREQGGQDLESAVAETVAYAAKAPEADGLESAVDLVVGSKGAKLVQPSGDLHGEVPDPGGNLLCGECRRTPRRWDYLGVVEERLDTMDVVESLRGDRPPDVSSAQN